jgi:subtilisin family serine protease
VGSVDGDDGTSFFSSHGPRMVDGLLKPEVTAPGNGIVAARAAHGRIGVRVGDSYTRLSGTSMAAPHVAGAAAILLQQHPDWDQSQLRAALTSTASYNPSADAYSQGGGRIDVDRATRQDVYVDAGTMNAGSPDGLQLGTTVGFVKQADEVQPTFRAIDRDGRPAEAFLVMRSPRVPDAFLAIDVPAGGSSTVQLEQGDYSILGYIRTLFGDTDSNTALTVVADPELEMAQPNRTGR